MFGLGAVLYEVLTGRPPNDHGRPHRVPPGPRAVVKVVDLDLDAVVRRALAFDPADRFKSAEDVAIEVERWLADQPIAAQRAAVRALAARAGAQRSDTTLAEQLARQRANLGLMFSGMGREAEAVAELTEAADAFAALAAARRRLRLRADEANCRLARARALLALGREDEAAAANKAASTIYAGLIDAGPAEYRANYADILLTYAGLPPIDPRPEVPPAEQTLAVPPRPESSADQAGLPATAAGDSTRPEVLDPSVEVGRPAGAEEVSGLLWSGEGASSPDPNRTWPPHRGDPTPTPDAPEWDEWDERHEQHSHTPAGFTLLREIGRGGMSRVFLARDNELGRLVALKTLLPGALAPDGVRLRFRQEARLTAYVQHPNVVQVYGSGTGADGQPFLILDYLTGRSQSVAIDLSRPGWTPAHLDPLAQVCDALADAHARGVIHRDPKPSNIWVLPSGRPVLFDWGLAKYLPGHREPEVDGDLPLPEDAELTTAGAVMGTPAYMSPEQVRGEGSVTPAADVYTLGAGLYHAVAGRTPHRGDTVAATLDLARTGRFPRLREVRPDVPTALDAICAKALALRPGDRYPTVAALGADIRAFLAGRPVSVSPARFWARLFSRG